MSQELKINVCLVFFPKVDELTIKMIARKKLSYVTDVFTTVLFLRKFCVFLNDFSKISIAVPLLFCLPPSLKILSSKKKFLPSPHIHLNIIIHILLCTARVKDFCEYISILNAFSERINVLSMKLCNMINVRVIKNHSYDKEQRNVLKFTYIAWRYLFCRL